ncbi:hypothetical protein [Olivibacter jilunii]|uniref:hypothetical protein n=1 Tax=Olivibacter jilunii TaxID=985016 RepID=UPI003F16CC78
MSKIKARVGYLATDGKALLARIGAISLLQSAWVLQHEQTHKCFTARCLCILQGRFVRHPGPYWLSAKTLRSAKMSPRKFAVCTLMHYRCSKVPSDELSLLLYFAEKERS